MIQNYGKSFWFFIVLFLFAISQLFSQPYGNEWINFSNTYYKFDVSANGFYRITYTALGDAGIPVDTIQPKTIKIFRNGLPVYLYINGDQDNQFNAGDYIEFYGLKNDGSADTELYAVPSWQANTNYSLFNDTATYFITWDNSVSYYRYVEDSDTTFSSYSPLPYILKEQRNDYNTVYFGGPFTPANIYNPPYEETEGWFGPEFTSTYYVAVATDHIYAGAGTPVANVNIVFAMANNNDHNVNIVFTSVNDYITGTGFKNNFRSYSVLPSSLTEGSTQFKFDPLGNTTGSNPDRNTLAWISVKYPHTMELGNASSFRFFVPYNASKSHVVFSGFNSPAGTLLYDLTGHNRLTVIKSGNWVHALIPSGGEKECVMASENTVQYITDLRKTGAAGKFTDYEKDVTNYDYLIITHRSLWNEAVEYAGHRSSAVGGGYEPLVVDISELYDQFIYGIRKHPLSIRHFTDFIMDNWDTVPKALFLLGKSVEADLSRNSQYSYALNLVPTFGYPPSDNLLTAGLNGTIYEPAIPTGRLAARNGADVTLYLDKVIDYEKASLDPEEWMKKVIHFGGGKTPNEQSTIKNTLEGYEKIIEDTSFGGFVYTFLKTSSLPIEPEIATSAMDLISNGVSLLTFIGHSSASGFDVNIDDPGNYENYYGKFPLIMAIGCYSGNIHTPGEVFSEQWVLYPYRGSIAFFASSSLGELSTLSVYFDYIYRMLGQKFYGSSIGKILQEATRECQAVNNSPTFINSYYDMTFHGDPAMIIHSPLLPDLSVTQEDVFFNPSYVSTESGTFDMNVIVTNTGRAIKKEFQVEAVRDLPLLDDSNATVIKLHPQSLFKDTVTLTFPVDMLYGVGLNKFDITVNPGGIITESDYSNNFTDAILFIRSNDVVPVYPPEFAIIPINTVTLSASTGDPFAPSRNYIFQIDTNNTFLAPLATQTVTQSGGVIKWTPPFTLIDSTVYFWRIRWDGSNTWRGSSFEYIKDRYGWGQSHFNQFPEDEYSFIKWDSIPRKFNFLPAKRHLYCKTVGNASTPEEQGDTRYNIDLSLGEYSKCCANTPAIMVAVIDSLTLMPWQTPWGGMNNNNNFGQANDGSCPCPGLPRGESHFIFWTLDTADWYRSNLANLLTNIIPDGNYVLIYSYITPNADSWQSDLLLAFNLYGINTNSLIANPDNPFIILAKKGDPSFTPEFLQGNSPTETLTLEVDLESKWSYGTIGSTVIGPASQWKSLHWRVAEKESNDVAVLKLTGITSSGVNTLIPGLDSIGYTTTNISNLGSFVNASSYPYLKLTLFLRDDLLNTTAQLRSWRILFDGVPEAAINPFLFHYFFDDTLQEGASVQCTTAVQNISYYNMDSLRVHWWITGNDNNTTGSIYKTFEPLPAGDFLLAPFSYSTLGLAGFNSLWIEINPKDSLWQLEQSHINNIAQLPFFVTADKINPLLDVTFDGVHILNGDIVSATPDILVQLKDENRYLAINDSSRLDVYIKVPGAQEVKIPYDGSTLLFIPGTLPDNKAKVNYKPVFTKDGTYQLRVTGKDASNNRSGDMDYTITFEVITRPSITYFLNWPNPFSTSTRFVFTLTGSEVPDQIRIRIMTVSGKVIREIFGWELGLLHIGRNITEFSWDGTDQWGDRLANGVYLYKVDVRLNGETIEHRSTGADQYFHQGYGKMFLMR